MKLPKISADTSVGLVEAKPTELGPKQTPPRGTPGAAPETPTTNGKDRTFVQNKSSAHGSNEAASRLHRDPELDVAGLRTALPAHVADPIMRAVRSAQGPTRREAVLGLNLILSQPNPEKSLVAILLQRPRKNLSDDDVARFRATTRGPESIASGLAQAHRNHESLQVAAYLPLSVRNEVQDALVRHGNADEVRLAVEWIMRMTPRKNRGSYVVERLRQTKVLEDTVNGEVVRRPQEIVSAFASAFREGLRPTAGYVASLGEKATAAKLAVTIEATGLTQDPHWKRSNPTGRRGLLAEHLRKTQLELEVAGTAATVVQGILLLRVPAEFRPEQTLEETKAYCDAHGIDHEKIHHVRTTTGAFYGLNYTEIDLSVLKTDPDGRLRFTQIENVKAGSGNAGHARDQNERAMDGLSNPTIHFLFPEPSGEYLDRSQDLVRTNSHEVVRHTVGPLGNEAYTKSYGLQSEMLDLVRDALSA